MKRIWQKLPDLAKVAIVIVAIIVIYLTFSRVLAFIRATNRRIDDKGAVQAHQAAGETPTFTTSQYKAMADKLYYAMDGWGTDDDAVFEVIGQLKNNVDFLNVRSSFGIRDGYDLQDWLRGDFSSADIQRINNLLYAKGITYTI
jgi:uncharacterized protein YpmB